MAAPAVAEGGGVERSRMPYASAYLGEPRSKRPSRAPAAAEFAIKVRRLGLTPMLVILILYSSRRLLSCVMVFSPLAKLSVCVCDSSPMRYPVAITPKERSGIYWTLVSIAT